MLIDELWNCLDKVKSIKSKLDYYNEVLGDTSFLLAGLLGALLRLRDDWDMRRWIDDSLLIGVRLNQNSLSIWGVMIWGMENTTKQWTDSFYFEVELDDTKSSFNEYTFLFGDLNKPETSYEEFRTDCNFEMPPEKNWKYEIKQKRGLRV